MMYLRPVTLEEMIGVIIDRDVPPFATPPDGVAINLGAGNKHIVGARDLDLPEWDADLMQIPYNDGEVDTIYAIHFLEHIKDPRRMLRECQRVLRPGGRLYIGVPHYSSQGAFHDLDHKHFFSEDTWKNTFDQTYYSKEHDGWEFAIVNNLLVGIAERNLMVLTVLERLGSDVL